jgi:hypothetical protein
MRRGRILGATLACVVAAACGGGAGDGAGGDVTVRVDTVGDTIVVVTERGSRWGDARVEPVLHIGVLDGAEEYVFGDVGGIVLSEEGLLYVLDVQVPAVRVYDTEGRHVRTFGRRGGGPGELAQPTGMGILPDGRVLVSDPRNTRVNVYSADGEPLDSWPMPGGFFSSDQLHVTASGEAYVVAMLSEPMSPSMRSGLIRVGPPGTPADTIQPPEWEFEPPALVAQVESGQSRAISRAPVPFGPQSSWTFSPLGHVVGGVSTRYAIDAFPPGGRILRMERPVEPVPVAAGERAHREFTTTRNMRRTDPSWRWSGPSIPSSKAPFTSVRADAEGRVWVRVAAVGEPIPADERTEPQPGEPPGPDPWREPVVYDVFAPDGVLLGTVPMPRRFTWYGSRGEQVWGVTRDELGVEYVTLAILETARGDFAPLFENGMPPSR